MVFEDVQAQEETELPEIEGERETTMSPEAAIEPVMMIVPLVSPTLAPKARLVAVKPLPQLLRLVAPFTETASVTQVRSPLAANTISDDFARFV